MKKLLILLMMIIATDSHSSGIASNTNSAPCTNNTLETYSGNSNLAADWQPNTINLRWYNGNTLMDVQSSANTCVYDSTLTIPQTAPTRTGYTFDGWTVRPEIDFAATIPTDTNGLERWAKGERNNVDYCYHDMHTGTAKEVICENDFEELQQYEWKVKFNHGMLYGMAGCSATTADVSFQTYENITIIPSGTICWCKVTGYKANNDSVVNSSMYDLPWVSSYNYSGVNCDLKCASRCANAAEFYPAARTALFTPAN